MTLVAYEHSRSIPVDPLFENHLPETNGTIENEITQDRSTSQPQAAKSDTNIDNPSIRTVPAEQNTNAETAPTSQADTVEVLDTPEPEQLAFTDPIDREAIAEFINKTALITYEIKPFKTTDYLPSLNKLASLIKNTGLGAAYGVPHFNPDNPSEYMVHVILFAADRDSVDKLHLYAKNKFNELSDAYRLHFAHMHSDKYRKQYDAIISNGNEVSTHSFRLLEQIRPIVDPDGDKYYDHFFVNEEEGYAKIKLDTWEKAVIGEESQHLPGFVCWIRNPTKGWGLCLQRFENGIVRGFYPDFLIIRNVEGIGYVIDILEPHRSNLTDNLSKAKAFADYAQKQPSAPIGRLQLIREGKDNITGKKRMKRLDLMKSAVRARVMQIQTTQELDNLFLDDNLVD